MNSASTQTTPSLSSQSSSRVYKKVRVLKDSLFSVSMKKAYPDYKSKGISGDKLFAKLDSKDKAIIDEFIKYCSISAGPNKLRDIKLSLLQFRDIIEVPYKEVDLKVLRDYLVVLENSDRKEWTKNGTKTHLKKFLRWLNKDWSERFDSFKDIKTRKAFNEERINENNLVTSDELKALCHAAISYRDKAIVMMLYETGARPQELRQLKWKDIIFKEDGTAKVHLYSGKTSTARTVLIKDSILTLQDWKQNYSYPYLTNNDLVFPSSINRDFMISDGNFSLLFKELSKRANLKRPVFPYLLRHTRLNELHKILPEQIHKKFAGHTKDSRMTAVYSHISSDDVVDSLLAKVYKVEKLTEKQMNKYDKRIAELETALAKAIDISTKSNDFVIGEVNKIKEAYAANIEKLSDQLSKLKGGEKKK